MTGIDDAENTARILAWADQVDATDYYQILDLDRRAAAPEIKAAFHRFALAFHPDAHVGVAPETAAALRRVFNYGAEAYRVLSDSELRLRYDMGLTRGELRLSNSQVPSRPEMNEPGKPLDELCRSAGAKLCAKRADALLAEGDLHGAKRLLVQALDYDGGANLRLSERIEALELALYAMGE